MSVLSFEPVTGTVRVVFAGEVVLETRNAVRLKEGGLPPVLYLPREDARMECFRRTTHKTHCPRKGDAAYYSIEAGGRTAENAVWTYETPFPTAEPIKGHFAFYPNRVDRIEVLEG